MKKHVFTFILALAIILPTAAVASPAESRSGGIGGFAAITPASYAAGTFSDVDENEWYGANGTGAVKRAYELRIMAGKDDGRFDPEGYITISEAITMAARVHNIYHGGDGEFPMGEPWYSEIVNYAVSHGIIGADDFGNYEQNATRAQMAHIFAGTVPASELREINAVEYLPDVSESGQYGASIFRLYRAGILAGNDDAGTFTPDTPIIRAQAAAIIARVVLPDQRVPLTLTRVTTITIRGQQYSTDLTELTINGAGLTSEDIVPLRYMTNLRSLNLENNQISDITPLAGLTGLTRLSMGENLISDLTPLAGLTNLTYLYIGFNQIRDITPLAGLTNMMYLWLENRSSTSLVNQDNFRLNGRNQISDLSPIAGMTNLRELHVGQNMIRDLSPLAGMTNLGILYIWRNPISDLSPLAGLTNLYWMSAWDCQISDLSPLAGLTRFTTLYLPGNPLRDISPLAGLMNLNDVDLQYTYISDWSPVSHVANVRGRP